MKVGVHAGEPLASIIQRKKVEELRLGRMYWGYSGSICHPTRQVKPFIEMAKSGGLPIYVMMTETASKFEAVRTISKEFSEDGTAWNYLPKSAKVVASRYALVLRRLRPCNLELDLASYVVATGPSKGKRFDQYIQGRVDKGCAIHAPTPPASPKPVPVAFIAELVQPYAVFLR